MTLHITNKKIIEAASNVQISVYHKYYNMASDIISKVPCCAPHSNGLPVVLFVVIRP